MTGTDTAPAIAVEGLWQVFGPNARAALTEARADGAGTAATLKARGLIPAVREASFEVASGELFVIMGLSGSGKSTLVRCISRLIEPTAGAVRINGEDILTASDKRLIEMRRDTLGMVFQHFGLFPHMSVADNVAFPLKMKGEGKAARRARALEVLNLVGLEGREDAFPRELSGGQRQRVGIARSLAVNPDIWFLDEPFSALDPLIRRQLQDEFLSIQSNLQKSIVFITHDIAEALKLADRIAIMRDGEIVQIGTPTQIVLNPVDDYVREFTRDVPRGRHMTLDEVMEPVGETTPAGDWPELRTGMNLETALTLCAASFEAVPVQDGDGKVVGVVHPESFVRALGGEHG
ncbi:quaternary amine ABC transporter ATP-binding protein [Shimia biformata]|uniref:quaternary amine ABC transporter ATP-binding protein n=1 Tax=Shimia biformata TaxID=1294299 RepID=UPI0019513535|nr:glycine betaine/L-proline ABC transporter ATP-binding protein [Shimia biformata]